MKAIDKASVGTEKALARVVVYQMLNDMEMLTLRDENVEAIRNLLEGDPEAIQVICTELRKRYSEVQFIPRDQRNGSAGVEPNDLLNLASKIESSVA